MTGDQKEKEIEESWNAYRETATQETLQRSIWLSLRYKEQNGLCAYCGIGMLEMRAENTDAWYSDYMLRPTCDHVTPLSLEGTENFDNIVAACAKCNSVKSNIPPEIWNGWVEYARNKYSEPEDRKRYLGLESRAYLSIHAAEK